MNQSYLAGQNMQKVAAMLDQRRDIKGPRLVSDRAQLGLLIDVKGVRFFLLPCKERLSVEGKVIFLKKYGFCGLIHGHIFAIGGDCVWLRPPDPDGRPGVREVWNVACLAVSDDDHLKLEQGVVLILVFNRNLPSAELILANFPLFELPFDFVWILFDKGAFHDYPRRGYIS